MILNQLDIIASFRKLCHLNQLLVTMMMMRMLDDEDDDEDALNKRLTHDIKVSVQFSHSCSCSALVHRHDESPFVQVRIVAFTWLQRSWSVVPTDRVQVRLHKTTHFMCNKPRFNDIHTICHKWWVEFIETMPHPYHQNYTITFVFLQDLKLLSVNR